MSLPLHILDRFIEILPTIGHDAHILDRLKVVDHRQQ